MSLAVAFIGTGNYLAFFDEWYRTGKKFLAAGVIAKWHDESHLNRFFIDHKPDVFTLGPGFAYPSQIPGVLNVTPRIWHLDKNNTLYRD